MEFKEGNFYKVICKYAEWVFLCEKVSLHKLDVYGYHINNNFFLNEFYLYLESTYSYQEISKDELISYFPDNDIMKITYFRKQKIVNLLKC